MVRRVVTMVLVVSIVVAVYVHRIDLRAALDDVAALSAGWALVLLAVFALGMVAQSLVLQAVTPGLTLRQSWMVQESATAATHTVVGSGPVSTGVRIAMLRRWQISDRAVGISIVAQNVIAAFAVWTVALLTALAGIGGATKNLIDHRVFLGVSIAATVMLTGSLLFWWLLLSHPAPIRWIAQRLQRLLQRTHRRWPRVPALDLITIAERGRTDARSLLRNRGRRIALATLFDQTMTVAKPVIVIRAFGISGAVLPTTTILVAWGLVRLAAALSPLPGGLGVTEIGLATLLTRFGGPEATVLAAVLTYRVLTFVLPMFTGGACLAWWRWHHRSTPIVEDDLAMPDLVSAVELR
jgi:glycosyltransferase 2 family protein